jgi:hypothetical protein
MVRQEELIAAVGQRKIEWSAHALRRMLERGISRDAVLHVLCHGEIIESYPDDRPFPSALLFGIRGDKALHAVAAYNPAEQKVVIISAYHPDAEHFEPDFKTRKKK